MKKTNIKNFPDNEIESIINDYLTMSNDTNLKRVTDKLDEINLVMPVKFENDQIKEIVLSGRQNKIKLFYSKNDYAIAYDKMKLAGIYEFKDRRYSDLSGGQQQRVLLARALCVSNKLLVLDEPITGLDIENQNIFYNLITKLNKKGTTVIMISHDSNIKNMSHVLCVKSDNVSLISATKYLEALNE